MSLFNVATSVDSTIVKNQIVTAESAADAAQSVAERDYNDYAVHERSEGRREFYIVNSRTSLIISAAQTEREAQIRRDYTWHGNSTYQWTPGKGNL